MKKLLLLSLILLLILKANAQTYVSGGIYSNTTWTKTSSSYIVTDTVVVFPGVTLTIEPGVTVKFNDDKALEIREAALIAVGTSADSITFTSNSSTPKEGSWSRIYLNKGSMASTFKYCNFRYAENGIEDRTDGELIFNHCNFTHNVSGIGSANETAMTGTLITIDSSTFKYNSLYGINLTEIKAKLCINYCNISNNYTGLIGDKAYLTAYTDFYIKNSTFDSNHQGLSAGCRFLVENCIIRYNDIGISSQSYCKIKNCIIENNKTVGLISAIDSVTNCQIFDNEIGITVGVSNLLRNNIYNNNIGIEGNASNIINNNIMNNTIGINALRNQTIMFNTIEDDSIGIQIHDSTTIVSCNKICDNWTYGIKYIGVFNTVFSNNYFCTPDSINTIPLIFDGYDDPTYGLVKFMPLDTVCYKTLGIKEKKFNNSNGIKFYPNPFSTSATLEFDNPQGKPHQLSVFNALGQLVIQIENIKSNKLTIERKELQNGFYFYQLRNEEGFVGSGKIVID